MFTFTPKIRQVIYNVAKIAGGLIPLLVIFHILNPVSGDAVLNLIGVLGAIATGGAVTASTTLAAQIKDGTLDFTGTSAEQAIAAIQATIGQATAAASDLNQIRQAITTATAATPATASLPVSTCGINLR